MLTDYREIRDRIFELCRLKDLRPDFPETTKAGRVLLVWSSDQRVMARAFIPIYPDAGPVILGRLQHDLAGIFGEGWMEHEHHSDIAGDQGGPELGGPA